MCKFFALNVNLCFSKIISAWFKVMINCPVCGVGKDMFEKTLLVDINLYFFFFYFSLNYYLNWITLNITVININIKKCL